MDRDTFTETILAFKHRALFRPFTVVSVNGSRHEGTILKRWLIMLV